jgi:hypothetical protein
MTANGLASERNTSEYHGHACTKRAAINRPWLWETAHMLSGVVESANDARGDVAAR